MAMTGAWEYIQDGGGFIASPPAAALLGRADGPVPLQELLPSLHEQDRKRFEEALDNAFSAGAAFEIDLRVGFGEDFRVLRCAGGPLRAGGGRVVGLIREIAEPDVEPRQAPRDEDQGRFLLFMEAGAFRSWIKDAAGRYIFVNRLFALAHGLTEWGWLQPTLTDFDLFPAEVAGALRLNDDLARAAPGSIELEEEIVSPEGKREFFLVSKFAFRDNAGQCCVGGVAFDITRRKELELALRNSENHFRSLAELSPVPLAISSGEVISYVNPAFTRSYGYRREDIPTVGDWFEKAYPDQGYRERIIARWQTSLRAARDTGDLIEPLEATIRLKNGDERSVVIGTNFLDDKGKSLIGSYFDITQARAAEDRIRRLGRLYAASSECQTAIVHARSKNEIFSAICEVIVRESVARLASISLIDFSTRLMQPRFVAGEGKAYLQGLEFSIDPENPTSRGPNGSSVIEERPVWCQDFMHDPSTEFWRARAREFGWASSASLPIHEKGRIVGVLTLYFDEPSHFDPEIQSLLVKIADSVSFALDALAEQVEHEEANRQIEILAHYDALTGLPNRRHFMDALEKKIAHASVRNAGFAVHFIDLDNFKDINDTLGHVVGDRFLEMVARRLSASVREADLVCRLGGDEFVVIQSGVRKHDQAARFAEKLIARLREPYDISGNRIASSGSVGVSIYGPESPTADLLVSHADVALYRAKAQRGSMSFFTEEMDSELRSRVELIGQLQNAIEERQLFLVYQPQIDVRSGAVTGAEALVRWRHPTQGVVRPSKFIPLAEESGLIIRIGDWILNEACRQMKEWIEAGVAPPVIGINVSPQQIKKQLDFAGRLGAVLDAHGLSPDRVEMELTENVLLDVPQSADNIINRLRALGVRITLDDFGTGFSSLEYLSKFPVDRLKIAQKFVGDVATSPRSRAIVEATISLADKLRIEKIAEGVENEDQLEMLEGLGCFSYQGDYFSKPLSPAQALDFLTSASAV
jgi:diguanylate cyclase (GGDEF)-like protein/PAS domain S-box-containing protein